MAVRAADRLTLVVIPTPSYIRTYYLKQPAATAVPAKPTTVAAPGWSLTEPTYTPGSTDTLYTTQLTMWGDGSFDWSDVSKSASFEAAKLAWNLANQANGNASLASGMMTTSTVDPTLSNGTGKPIGAIWETTVAGVTNKRFLWTGSIWQQLEIGSSLIADTINGKIITGSSVIGGTIKGSAFEGQVFDIRYDTSLYPPTQRLGRTAIAGSSIDMAQELDNGPVLGSYHRIGVVSSDWGGVSTPGRRGRMHLRTYQHDVNGGTQGQMTGEVFIGGLANAAGQRVDLRASRAEFTDLLVDGYHAVNVGSYRNVIVNPDVGNAWQSIPNNTWTPLNLPSGASYNIMNTLNDGSPATVAATGIIAPRTGRYLVNVAIRWTGNTGGTARGVAVRVNNTGPRQMEANQRQPGGGFGPYPMPLSTTAEIMCNAGDTVQCVVVQNVGAALNGCLETYTISYLGP